jgi:serine/threonine protein kinase
MNGLKKVRALKQLGQLLTPYLNPCPYQAEQISQLYSLIQTQEIEVPGFPEANAFLQGLVAKQPERRLTAERALQHAWIDDARDCEEDDDDDEFEREGDDSEEGSDSDRASESGQSGRGGRSRACSDTGGRRAKSEEELGEAEQLVASV